MKRILGFTLVELLIASAIFSVIILSIYSAFRTGVLSYHKMDSALGLYQTARVVLNRIELDLNNSFNYSNDDSRFRGDNKTLELFSIIDTFQEGNTETHTCHIIYELDNGILKRSCYQNINAISDKPRSEISESDELSSYVKDISFQYAYPTDNPDKPYDWQDVWPRETEPNQQKALPLAVKIRLSLIEKDRQQKEKGIVEFNKTVFLPING